MPEQEAKIEAMRISTEAVRTFESPIGPITLTVSAEKITSVELNKKVKNSGQAKVFAEAEAQLTRYFKGDLRKFSLPTKVCGTPFQEAVWREIAKLPFGSIISYGAIASKIGKPAAARAVGMAVGANPIPLIVGCHRVLGSTGKLTGYSGGKGLKTKIALLELEGISYRQ